MSSRSEIVQGPWRFVAVHGPLALLSRSSHRLWSVGVGATLELNETIFAGGYDAALGGCVYVQRGGTLVARDAIFENCSAFAGGGVAAWSGASLTLLGASVVRNCHASKIGGGLYGGKHSVMTLADSTLVEKCSAGERGGGVAVADFGALEVFGATRFLDCAAAWGGALDVGNGASAVLGAGVFIERCTASLYGGGVSNAGGYFLVAGHVRDCHAHRGGGGIFSIGKNASGTFRGTLSGCSSVIGGGIFADGDFFMDVDGLIERCSASESGGGLYAWHEAQATLSGRARIVNCSAGDVAGGVWLVGDVVVVVMRDDAFIGDCQSQSGGGLLVDRGSLVVLEGHASLAGCTSVKSGGGAHVARGGSLVAKDFAKIVRCASLVGDGGGLAVESQAQVRFLGEAQLSENVALGGRGGGAYVEGRMALLGAVGIRKNAATEGGGLCVDGGGKLYASSSCRFLELRVYNLAANDGFKDNTKSLALIRTDKLFLEDARGWPTHFEVKEEDTLAVDFCLPPAEDYALDLYSRTSESWNGGTAALALDVFGSRLVAPTTLLEGQHVVRTKLDAQVLFGGGGDDDDDDDSAYASGEPCVISSNVAFLGHGGGILLAEGGTARIHEAFITNNTAATHAGGLKVESLSDLELSQSRLAGNRVRHNGGGFACTFLSRVTLSGVIVESNAARDQGGGGRMEAPHVGRLFNTTFENNVASSGGGLFVAGSYTEDDRSRIDIDSCVFAKNALRGDDDSVGAGLAVDDAVLYVRATNFTDNQAEIRGSGAAVAINKATSKVRFARASDAAACVRVQVVTDATRTTDTCEAFRYAGVGQEGHLTCDGWGTDCDVIETDKATWGQQDCSGCACSQPTARRFYSITNDETQEEVGRGSMQAAAVKVDEHCLEASKRYRVRAYDTLGQAWFGAAWRLRVFEADRQTVAVEAAGPPFEASGYESASSLGFEAGAAKVSCAARGNRAPHGGGGFLYYAAAAPRPPNSYDVQDLGGNDASYGSFVATPARTLRILSTNGTYASGQVLDAPFVEVELLDELGQRVRSLVGVSASFRVTEDDGGDAEVSNSVAPLDESGVATFKTLVVTATPGRTVSAIVSSALKTLTVQEQALTVFLRPCFDNEYLTAMVCYTCSEGYFLDAGSCAESPRGTTEEEGQTLESLVLEKGWFRATRESSLVIAARPAWAVPKSATASARRATRGPSARAAARVTTPSARGAAAPSASGTRGPTCSCPFSPWASPYSSSSSR